jgi:hypothetical protein
MKSIKLVDINKQMELQNKTLNTIRGGGGVDQGSISEGCSCPCSCCCDICTGAKADVKSTNNTNNCKCHSKGDSMV